MKSLVVLALLLPGLSLAANPPTNLSAKLQADGSVKLSWTAAPGVSGYNIIQASSVAGAMSAAIADQHTVGGDVLNPGTVTSYTFPAGSCTSKCYYVMTSWSCPATGCLPLSAPSPAASVDATPVSVATFSAIDQMTGCTRTPPVEVVGQPYTIKCTGLTQTVTPQ